MQDATSLTRRTIVEILIGSERLGEFIGNPGHFIAMAKSVLESEPGAILVDGVQYERIADSVYVLRELQKDGEEAKERFLDQLHKVQYTQKTDADYVVFDSDVERQFAELLDSREDFKLFMKIPAKFEIDTPVGQHNPDWAIIKQEEGEDRTYMIRETKSTSDGSRLRPTDRHSIKSAERHFEAIGIEDYARAAPGAWNP